MSCCTRAVTVRTFQAARQFEPMQRTSMVLSDLYSCSGDVVTRSDPLVISSTVPLMCATIFPSLSHSTGYACTWVNSLDGNDDFYQLLRHGSFSRAEGALRRTMRAGNGAGCHRSGAQLASPGVTCPSQQSAIVATHRKSRK